MNCIFCPNEKVEDVGKGRYFCHHCSQWFFIEDKNVTKVVSTDTAVSEILSTKKLVLKWFINLNKIKFTIFLSI